LRASKNSGHQTAIAGFAVLPADGLSIKGMNMPDPNLLEVLLDAWDRNNAILINLLNAVPKGGLEARVMPDSPSVAQMFTHMHYVRLVLVSEDAPEFASEPTQAEWLEEHDLTRISQMLNDSAKTVHDAVKARVETNQNMNLHYDHPILFLQHMIWHEGYHHGQIKLVLKLTGSPMSNQSLGSGTWGVWMNKRQTE
jgi:uncharacterized damage-inducible protein DinB